jgi:hypothetical protein
MENDFCLQTQNSQKLKSDIEKLQQELQKERNKSMKKSSLLKSYISEFKMRVDYNQKLLNETPLTESSKLLDVIRL